MSQTTDPFEETEERMSEGQLKYSDEPVDRFPDSGMLTEEDHGKTVDLSADPEEAQVRATQTETTTMICLQPSLWAEPSTTQRAAGDRKSVV